MVHCALEIRCKTSCKKCHIHSIYLQFPFLIYAHFFVAKTIYALFCHKKNLCTLFLSRTQFTRFFAKMIYALRPESFCALKVAIRKVQTFWASGPWFIRKLPRKSSLNVRSVCPLCSFRLVCPVCAVCPGSPVCSDDHDDHDGHKTRCQIWCTIELHRDPISKVLSEWWKWF